MNIAHGHIYRAKKPQFNEFGEYNDRQVVHVSNTQVQYDSSTLQTGRRYPTVDREKFEKWAGKDVTSGYPKGTWETKKEKRS